MTDSLENDPIINAVYQGLKADIDMALSAQRWRATLILIYAGIDTMASLDMPANQLDVKREDFIRWVEGYIRFPCKDQLPGIDLYGARCALLHTYSDESALSRAGKCRKIIYTDETVPAINPLDAEHVFVSIPALRKALFTGIDDFLVNAFASKPKAKTVEERLNTLVQIYPLRK